MLFTDGLIDYAIMEKVYWFDEREEGRLNERRQFETGKKGETSKMALNGPIETKFSLNLNEEMSDVKAGKAEWSFFYFFYHYLCVCRCLRRRKDVSFFKAKSLLQFDYDIRNIIKKMIEHQLIKEILFDSDQINAIKFLSTRKISEETKEDINHLEYELFFGHSESSQVILNLLSIMRTSNKEIDNRIYSQFIRLYKTNINSEVNIHTRIN